MGKLDRRSSLKMCRRKAQAKKKVRLMRPKSDKALAAAGIVKPEKKVAPKPIEPAASAPGDAG